MVASPGGLLAQICLLLWFDYAAGTCPSVAITKNVWVDGYHSENVLFSDASDNCAVKCSAGWLWLGLEWPDFQEESSVTFDGTTYSADDGYSSKNVTCTCPPPQCAATCNPKSVIAPCDTQRLICNQILPFVAINNGCEQITCLSGTSLISVAFESWRVGDFAQCGSDNVWYGQTGWILNQTNYLITCAVEKGGKSCPALQPTDDCPDGLTCDSSGVSSTTVSGALSVTCKTGVLVVVNDPNWGPVTPGDTTVTLQCGESGKWYRTGGITTAARPQVTCVTGTAPPPPPPPTKAPVPSAPQCEGVLHDCDPSSQICSSGHVQKQGTGYACPPGSRLVGPGLTKASGNSVVCGPDGQWTTSGGEAVADIGQLSCVAFETGTNCQFAIAPSGCPTGYQCDGLSLEAVMVISPTGSSAKILRCIEFGIPFITTNPAFASVDLSKATQFVCGSDRQWYQSPGGRPAYPTDQFTCMLTDCKECCMKLYPKPCNPVIQNCGAVPSAPVFRSTFPQTYTCPAGTKITGSPILDSTNTNTITCAQDASWSASASVPLYEEIRQVTCLPIGAPMNAVRQAAMSAGGCPGIAAVQCDPTYQICASATPPGQTATGFTCPPGTKLTGRNGLGKLNANGLVCGANRVWTTTTGMPVSGVNQVTCITQDTGVNCPVTVGTSGCPVGYQCLNKLANASPGVSPTGEPVSILRCLGTGVMIITNDPIFSRVDLSRPSLFVCGKDNQWYSANGGQKTVARPTVMCVTASCTNCCLALFTIPCNPNSQNCGATPATPVMSTTTPKSYSCPEGTRLSGSPSLDNANVNSITCGIDSTWATPTGQKIPDVRQITCVSV